MELTAALLADRDVGERVPDLPIERLYPQGSIELDSYEFTAQPMLGPLVVYRRHLGGVSDAGALVARHASPVAPETKTLNTLHWATVDASDLEPMSDGDFWEWIDLLDGRAWERTIEHVERELAKRPESEILAFAQAVSLKMFDLDDPEMCEQFVDDEGVTFAVTDLSQHARGAAIAGGRERYETVLRAPEKFESRWMSDLSPMVAHIGAGALTRRRRDGRHYRIETRWSLQPSSNRARWDVSGMQVRDRPRPSAEPTFEARLAAVHQAQRESFERCGIDVESLGVIVGWVRVRIFVARDARLDEVLVLLPVADAGEDAALAAVRRWLADEKLEIVGEPEILAGLLGHPNRGTVYEFVRREAGSVEQYADRYGFAPPASTAASAARAPEVGATATKPR